MKKNPNIATPPMAWMTLDAERFREPNSRSGRSGLRAVAWRTTKATSKITATPPNPRVCAEARPYSDDCTMA